MTLTWNIGLPAKCCACSSFVRLFLTISKLIFPQSRISISGQFYAFTWQSWSFKVMITISNCLPSIPLPHAWWHCWRLTPVWLKNISVNGCTSNIPPPLGLSHSGRKLKFSTIIYLGKEVKFYGVGYNNKMVIDLREFLAFVYLFHSFVCIPYSLIITLILWMIPLEKNIQGFRKFVVFNTQSIFHWSPATI